MVANIHGEVIIMRLPVWAKPLAIVDLRACVFPMKNTKGETEEIHGKLRVPHD